MAINLSNLFNNTNIAGTNTGNVTSSDSSGNPVSESANAIKQAIENANTKDSSGITVLKNMLAGDTFSGTVTNIQENAVSILLNTGTTINANLSDNVQIQKGENLTFIVEENVNDKIKIKPLDTSSQALTVINKALEAANLPINDKNINVVKELLTLNMPINQKTITTLSKQYQKFPEANLNTLANLNRLNIPVNIENIGQFEAYRQFNAQLEKSLNKLENDLLDDLNTLLNKEDISTNINNNSTDQNINPDITKNIIENLGQNSTQTFKKIGTVLKSVINNLYSNLENNENIKQLRDILGEESLNKLSEQISDKELSSHIKSGEINIKTALDKLLNNEEFVNSNGLEKLISNKDFKTIFHEIINETMKLTPKEVEDSENAINNFYKRVKKNIEEINKDLKELNITPQTSKTIENFKNNIDFMNELNKNLMFFQMPIKFSDSEGNGELYVFTNKKNLKYDPDNISALLHLDMENLGPLDVFVKLQQGQNLTTNFILESDEMLDFVYSHIDKLEKRLSELGYNTHFEMNVKENKESNFDFVRDFIERDVNPKQMNQYIFDTKA